jgi:membrane associated rhomboid family serine protease
MTSYYHQESQGFSFASRNRITYAVQRLILANVIVFAGQLILEVPFGDPSLPRGGIATYFLSYSSESLFHGFVWQPFTYMFLHDGLWHLFFNMLVLYFFGPDVERTLSTRQFFRFYILCGALGVLAGLVPWLINGSSPLVLGASGATLGVLVAYAFVFPDREIILFPLPFPINVRAIVVVIVVINLLDAMRVTSNIAVSTHLGGMAVAYAYMKLAPHFRDWSGSFFKRRRRSKDEVDPLGEAVDNIFKFDDERRRRK